MDICSIIGHINKKYKRSYHLNKEQYASCSCGQVRKEAWMLDTNICSCGAELKHTKVWVQEFKCCVCKVITK